MTKLSALSRKTKVSHGYVVRRPRAVDGVGSALRAAFGPEGANLPADMRALLCSLENGTRG